MAKRAIILIVLGAGAAAMLAVLMMTVWPRRTLESPPPEPAPLKPPAIVSTSPLPVAPEAMPSVTIESPTENATVPRVFEATGTSGPLAAGQHLWLMVQLGRVFAPKVEAGPDADGRWRGQVREFGVQVGNPFHLCLFLVNDEGHETILRWLDKGRETKSYPPFREVPGGVLLTRVALRLGATPRP